MLISSKNRTTFYKRTITGLILLAGVSAAICWMPAFLFSLGLISLWILLARQEMPRLIGKKNPNVLLWNILYLGVPFGMFAILQASSTYYLLALLAVWLTAAHDTGAYITGNLIGKTALSPSISPGKTWEGVFGGWFWVIVTLMVWKLLHNPYLAWWHIPLLALPISMIATLGDLFESLLKRQAGIKDSGSILPGHGGILDRIDGLLAVLVYFYLMRAPWASLLL
jgi:phosphatidate cytidylyltransferase